MRIAVTGAAGFLGRQVAAALVAAGHDVSGLDAVPGPAVPWPVQVLDLRDPAATRAAVQGCDGVAHLAGYPRAGDHDPHEVFTTNTSISFSVVDAAVAVGVRSFVYVSSISAVGYPFFVQPIVPAHLPLDESAPTVPQDTYGQSKLVGELLIDGAVARTGGALSAVSLRLPALHTPESFVEQMPATFRTGKDRRLLWAWIDTRDAADAVVAAFARAPGGHAKLFLAAPESFHPLATPELLAAHFPDVPLTRPLTGHAALVDSSAATALLGVTPHRAWRGYPGAVELLDRLAGTEVRS